MNRRHFVQGAVALAASTSLAAPPAAPEVLYRQLGKTGEKVSAIGVGGFHLSIPTEPEALQIVRAALDGGLNFLDNCWDYADGKSEVRMGKALKDGYRNKAFLMTKVDGRNAKSAMAQLEQSLTRLQTDRIDLIQMHEIIRPNDPDLIFAAGGAMEALVKAQKAGKVRFIGFTGHKSPAIHKKMLEVAKANNFRFDAVQLPLNVMDAHHDSFEKEVLPMLVKEQIGVLGMKAMGGPFILESNTATPVECLKYAMSLPVSVTITGIDSMKILDQALSLARGFKPMSAAEKTAILAKTKAASAKGEFERYKSTIHFDGTTRNPAWLG